MIVRKLYGGSPLHLLGHVALFGLVFYSVFQVFDQIDAGKNFLVWMVGAIVLHDAILWPVYSGMSRFGTRALGTGLNYIRVPLGLSLLLLLVFVGTVLGEGGNAYRNASRVSYEGYLARWFIVSVALFVISGLVLVFKKMDGESEPASPPESQPPH